jgi:imidazolonepropionase
VDAFCEKGAWSLRDCVRLFRAAIAAGHPIRVHADQFTSLGMVEEAIALGARSVDHLEASTAQTLAALAVSETFGVGLPVCGFHLDGRYAQLGKLVELGGKVCVATNYNPGSAPSPSMAFAIALAVRHCGLTAAQAIVAATLNPAVLLGFGDRGYIAPGARADLILLRHRDERALAYEVGDTPIRRVICGGVVLDLWHGMHA